MKLFLVRHGQTEWNLLCRAQGQVDIPLNETGIKQAKVLGEKIKKYQFDICYSSPLKRAKETAEIIVNGKCKIIFDDDLKERNFGNLEGSDPKTWKENDFDLRLNTTEGGMEPIKDVFIRAKRALERIKAENPSDAKVLIVAHGTLLKAVHFNIIGYTDDTDISTYRLKNGDIVGYDI